MSSSENSVISDESKNVLQSHWKDLKFVDDNFKLRGYRCCSCRNVAIMHCIANCGDPFCNTCYLEHYKKPCPYCKETVDTNSQDQGFESAVFDLKVECKFKQNGCEEIFELRNFLNHINMCRFETKKLLPKVYREDPIAYQIQQLNGDVNCIKQLLEAVQAENSRISCEFQEMKDSLINMSRNVELQATKLKQLTDEIHNKDAADLIQAEVMQLKFTQMRNEAKKVLQKDHNTQIEKIKGMTELLKTEMLQLKQTLKKSDEAIKQWQEDGNSQIKNVKEKHKALAENEIRNEAYTKIMQKEIMELKSALKKSEESSKVLQEKRNSQIDETLAEYELRNDIATKSMKKGIMELKNALKKSEETVKELQETSNSVRRSQSMAASHLVAPYCVPAGLNARHISFAGPPRGQPRGVRTRIRPLRGARTPFHGNKNVNGRKV